MAIVEMNAALFQKEIVEAGKPALVEFYAPWCVYCRRIAPALDKLAEQLEGTILIAKINIDEEPALSDAQGIDLVPTLILYDNGKALGSVVNPPSKAAMEAFIAETLKK